MSLFSRRHDQELPYEPLAHQFRDDFNEVEQEIADKARGNSAGEFFLTLWDIEELPTCAWQRVTWGTGGVSDFEDASDAWAFYHRTDPALSPAKPIAVPLGVVRR